MAISKISVDLRARSFDIEVPDERVDEVLSRLEALLQLPLPVGAAPAPEQAGGIEDVGVPEQGPPQNGGGQEVEKPESSRRKGKGPSTATAYELVDLGLTPEQRQDVRSFYAEKAPDGQNERVAVLGYKLKEHLKRAEFNTNEIHSAFKVVDEPTPRNLRAVFGNMKRDGRAGYTDNKIVINSHTDDFVAYHMDKKKKPAK